MPGLLLNRIVDVQVASGAPCLTLTWENGQTTRFDMAPVIAQGGVFATLSRRESLASVAVGPRGRSLVWPGEIDMDADALWFDAHPADNPFNQPVAAE